MRASKINIRELDRCTGPDFDQLYSIYVNAFPVMEQRPISYIKDTVKRSDYRVLLLERETIIAFAILFCPENLPMALLDYLATHDEHRNKGIGKIIFEECVNAIEGKVLVVEVDSDREEAEDKRLRECRKLFYRRLGCLQVDKLDYLMPQVSESMPPQMDLMVYRNNEIVDISRDELSGWLSAIYSGVYGESPDDYRIEQMLRDMGEKVRLF